MATFAEDDLYTFLGTKGLGITLFKGPRRAAQPPVIPHQCAFLLGVGGLQPSPYMDGVRTAYRFFRVQIWVRSEPNDFSGGRAKADAVWSACNLGAVTNYVRTTCEQSAPMYLGRDDVEHHEFVINVRMEQRAA